MSYATVADLYMRFGATNVRKWANLEGDGSMTDARIASALQVADDYIDSHLNMKWYKVPLVFTDQATARRVTQWSVALAGHWLYFCRGQLGTESEKDVQGVSLEALYKTITAEILAVANGTLQLNGMPKWAPNPRGPSVIL